MLPNWKDKLWEAVNKVRKEGGKVEVMKCEINKSEFRMEITYFPPKIHQSCEVENKYILED